MEYYQIVNRWEELKQKYKDDEFDDKYYLLELQKLNNISKDKNYPIVFPTNFHECTSKEEDNNESSWDDSWGSW